MHDKKPSDVALQIKSSMKYVQIDYQLWKVFIIHERNFLYKIKTVR